MQLIDIRPIWPKRTGRRILVVLGVVAIVWFFTAMSYAIARGLFCETFVFGQCFPVARQQVGNFFLLRWLSGWQTLTAGTVAFVAALLTAWVIEEQISQARQIENERRKLDGKSLARRKGAVVAVLPLAIYAISNHAKEICLWFNDICEKSPDNMVPQDIPLAQFSVFPTRGMDVLRDFTETLDEGEAWFASRLLLNASVMHANAEALRRSIANPSSHVSVSSVQNRMVWCGKVYAHTTIFLEYLHGDIPELPENFTRGKAATAMVGMLFQTHSFDWVYRLDQFKEKYLDKLVLKPRPKKTG